MTIVLCACGCPATRNCTCGSLCPCDPCRYCDRDADWEALTGQPATEADHGLALALAALASNAGCDIAGLIHDLDDSGECAADCSGCSLPADPPPPSWCQWCGENDHTIGDCDDFAARRAQLADAGTAATVEVDKPF